MARVYATADDLAGWLGDYPPVNAVVLLTRASVDIDNVLVGAWYAVDDNGLPTDVNVADALKRAVCAQVESWLLAQQQVMTGPQEDGWPRLARAVRPMEDPTKPVVCDEAIRILHTAGLLPVHTWTFG